MGEKIRLLEAEEIECKVSTISEKGCSLLLYKTARTDMDILDEVFGPENWKDSYREVKGNLYCTISVYNEDIGEWIDKEDCGVESAFGDKEKGEASDAFKRAGFRWGIGRELYTAPFIWVQADKVKLFQGNNGKWSTYDRFTVKEIGYDDRRKINYLVIVNQNNQEVYRFGAKAFIPPEPPQLITDGTLKQIEVLIHKLAELSGKTDEEAMTATMDKYHIEDITKITNKDGMDLVKVITGWIQQIKKDNRELVNQ